MGPLTVLPLVVAHVTGASFDGSATSRPFLRPIRRPSRRPSSRVFVEKNTEVSQWLAFKLLGITYLVGKIKFELLFHGPLAK